MCLLLKAATMPLLKKRIRLSNYPFHRDPYQITLSYFLDETRKTQVLERGEDAAIALYERCLISRFEGAGSHLKMYKKHLHTVEVGKDKRPVQMVSEVELEWDNIELMPSEIIDLVANWEYKITGRLMGLIPYPGEAKIIPIDRGFRPGKGNSQVKRAA